MEKVWPNSQQLIVALNEKEKEIYVLEEKIKELELLLKEKINANKCEICGKMFLNYNPNELIACNHKIICNNCKFYKCETCLNIYCDVCCYNFYNIIISCSICNKEYGCINCIKKTKKPIKESALSGFCCIFCKLKI